MAKNEIHARISPETMEQIQQLTHDRNFSTISDACRLLIDTGFKVLNDELEDQDTQNSVLRLIEQECKVFFSRCRNEHDPEDGQLYWFWFESKDESSWRYDPYSPNNWCPIKRFISQEDAIRDCLKCKLNQTIGESKVVATPDLLDELEPDNLIDW